MVVWIAGEGTAAPGALPGMHPGFQRSRRRGRRSLYVPLFGVNCVDVTMASLSGTGLRTSSPAVRSRRQPIDCSRAPGWAAAIASRAALGERRSALARRSCALLKNAGQNVDEARYWRRADEFADALDQKAFRTNRAKPTPHPDRAINHPPEGDQNRSPRCQRPMKKART